VKLLCRARDILRSVAQSEAPRGFVAALVALWTVCFMSALVWEVTMRLFGPESPDVGAGAATAYATLLGTGLAGAWAFFRWAQKRKDDAD